MNRFEHAQGGPCILRGGCSGSATGFKYCLSFKKLTLESDQKIKVNYYVTK